MRGAAARQKNTPARCFAARGTPWQALGLLQWYNVFRQRSLVSRDHGQLDRLPFLQASTTTTVADAGEMNKDIIALVTFNKAVALLAVKPFDRAFLPIRHRNSPSVNNGNMVLAAVGEGSVAACGQEGMV